MGSRVHEVHAPHEPASASIPRSLRAAVSQSPRVTSRCVTARTVRAPNATRSTPRRRASATNAAASASASGQREDDDVGLDRRAIEVDAGDGRLSRVGDQRGVARDRRRAARGGDRARSSAAAAKIPTWRIAPPSIRRAADGARDRVAGTGEQRCRPARRAPSRTPPTPRRTAPPARRPAVADRDRGVPQPRAVEVTGAMPWSRAAAQMRDRLALRHDHAAGAVVGVLDLDQRRRRHRADARAACAPRGTPRR